MNAESRWGALARGFSPGRLEFVRFALVGAATYVIDTAVFLALKADLLEAKPVTAKGVAVVVATVASYLLNRGWSFRRRRRLGIGREAVGYAVVAAGALLLSAAPLAASRYVFDLATPTVSAATEHVADLVSAQIVGTALGMAFRWWAFRRWVFPADREAVATAPGPVTATSDQRLPTGGTRVG